MTRIRSVFLGVGCLWRLIVGDDVKSGEPKLVLLCEEKEEDVGVEQLDVS